MKPSTQVRRCRAGRWPTTVGLLAAIVVGLSFPSGPSFAEEPKLKIELNKVEDNTGTCLASLLVRQDLGSKLDRFALDLFVFDGDGVIARQVLLDLAPLRTAKTTVVRFPLIERPCAEISQVLVNTIPSCRSAATGQDLDCLSDLAVSSRSRVQLIK